VRRVSCTTGRLPVAGSRPSGQAASTAPGCQWYAARDDPAVPPQCAPGPGSPVCAMRVGALLRGDVRGRRRAAPGLVR
jgi:hypothetical protein